MIPLWAFGVGIGVTWLALGWLHCLCWGCLCARGSVSTGQDFDRYVSGVHLLFVGLFAGGDWFQCDVFQRSGVGLGALGLILGVFLVHCVLCCAGDSDSALLAGHNRYDGGTSSPYIFLFMLLLVPFYVIG